MKQAYFLQILVKTGPCSGSKENNPLLSPFGKGCDTSLGKKKILYTQNFWPNNSGEEVKNVKSFQIDAWTDDE